jgi:hypothetical protein
VAKLIGVPPGYVGHAQTEPRLNQLVLDKATLRLGDGDEVNFLKKYPDARAVVMSGTTLDEEEMLLCQRYDIPFLQKPFIAEELLSALEAISLSTGSIRTAAG